MKNIKEWISCYIFHNTSFEVVLNELIGPVMERLLTEKLIDNFFFVRYWENGPHLRLRILANKDHENDEIVLLLKDIFSNYFNPQLQNGISYSIEFNEYLKEIERYGGEKNMFVSEAFFNKSSKTVISLVREYYVFWDYSLAMSFALQLHIIFAKVFFDDLDYAVMFFKKVYKNWLSCAVKLDQNGNVTNAELKKLQIYFDNSYLNQQERLKKLFTVISTDNNNDDIMAEWMNSCKEILNLSRKNDEIPEYELITIYDSYIHMTNNRLGIHLRDEAFIAFLIYSTIENIVENK